MNNGLFGFSPGKNITIDVQFFEDTGIWNKPPNAKFCFIEGTGGGQAGQNGSPTAEGDSGAAGVAYQIIMDASKFSQQETVVIGDGGASNGAYGNNTTFSTLIWAGGGGEGAPRYGYIGVAGSNGFGSGAANSGISGRHGNFGAGGGGAGGLSGVDGSPGGKPRTFQFASASQTAQTGGGAAGGTSVSGPGKDADPANDRHGFGEGGGGGYGNPGGVGGSGGRGRRGSGGGGGGLGTTGGNGGRGGKGFLRIQTYCWE